MTLATFDPSRKPSPGTSQSPKVRLLKTEFGDGYQQRSRDGLNHVQDVCSLTWDFLTVVEADAIVGFFRDQGGDLPFLYKPTNLPNAIKWTCDTWTDKVRDDGFRTVTATFERSFSNDS